MASESEPVRVMFAAGTQPVTLTPTLSPQGRGSGVITFHHFQCFADKMRHRRFSVLAGFEFGQPCVGFLGRHMQTIGSIGHPGLNGIARKSAAAFLTDFYRPRVADRSEAHYFRVSRLMTAAFGVAQAAVALLAARLNDPQSIVEQVLAIAGLTTGLILGLFLLGSLRRVVSSTSAIVGLVVALIAVMAVGIPQAFGYRILAFPWFAPLGAPSPIV